MADPAPVALTDRALARVKRLLSEADEDGLKLRVFVTGGGCSGFQYGFTFDSLVADDDSVVSVDGVTVLVDALSGQYIHGSEVDYEENLAGSRFVLINPSAKTTCGCGASFSI
jgi:iron-sulfur cluster insertion protein